MNATESTPAEKTKAHPAVKLAPDIHRAIALRKLRGAGQIQEQVDAALRKAYAAEIAQLESE